MKVTDPCPASPGEFALTYDGEDGKHECLENEMRCAYCGERLDPYPCRGCGKFLTAKRMHQAANDGIWRCEECT